MFRYPTIITENSFQTVIDGCVYTADRTHPNFRLLIDAVKEDRWEDVPKLAKIANAVSKYLDGKIEVDVDNGTVKYAGEVVHGSITTRILDFMSQGLPVEPLCLFIENLNQNPSKRAVDELFGFIEYGNMPLTEDGCFLAYKRVNDDYTSVHDRKTDNSIGKIVSMPRNKVDDDKNNTCSYGLHFCSHAYLKSFSGSRVVILKINPRDVVSIPVDYNNTKGRTCQYEVVGELTPDEVKRALDNSVWSSAMVDYDDRGSWEKDDDYDPFDDVRSEADRREDEIMNAYESGQRQGRTDALRGSPYHGVIEDPSDDPDLDKAFEDGYYEGWDSAFNSFRL